MALLKDRLGRLTATALATAVALWTPIAPSQAAASADALEYAVKANYLYKFAPFVEWPSGAFVSATSPFSVCLLGADPFGHTLDEVVRGQRVDGRPVVVRRVRVAGAAGDCHVLYLGRQRPQSADESLKAVRGAPVLTVTDDGQGVHGGIVHFVLVNGRVRFNLDAEHAQASGLVLSSKLRALAAPPSQH